MSNDIELAWIAGLVVGEGSFGFYANYARFQMQMTDGRAVHRAATRLGLRVGVYDYSATPRGCRTPVFKIQCGGKPAERIILDLLPYLEGTDKGDQAKAVLGAVATRRASRSNPIGFDPAV